MQAQVVHDQHDVVKRVPAPEVIQEGLELALVDGVVVDLDVLQTHLLGGSQNDCFAWLLDPAHVDLGIVPFAGPDMRWQSPLRHDKFIQHDDSESSFPRHPHVISKVNSLKQYIPLLLAGWDLGLLEDFLLDFQLAVELSQFVDGYLGAGVPLLE